MTKVNGNQKGKRVELEVVNWLKANGLTDVRRSQQYNGQAGDADIVGNDVEEFHIESKGTKSCNLNKSTLKKWHNQLEVDNKHGKFPVIFFKGNSCNFILLVPLDKYPVGWRQDFNTWMVAVTAESFNPHGYFYSRTLTKELEDVWRGVTRNDGCLETLLFKVEEGKYFLAFEAEKFLHLKKKLNEKRS